MSLNSHNVNKNSIWHKEKQPKMQASILYEYHFGPFHTSAHILQPGDTQSVVFMYTDSDLCNLIQKERKKERLDMNLGK